MKGVHSKAYLALILTCLIWGTTYLVNKLGVTRIPPFFFTSVRQIVSGTIILVYIFLIKRAPLPSKKYILFQVLLAFLLITLGNGIGTYGLSYIDSGISAILASLSPIIIALLTIYFRPSDQLSSLGWFGIFLGFVGLIFICFDKFSWPIGQNTTAIGLILTIVSVGAWGVGSVISKTKTYPYSPLMAAGFQMFFGGLPMAFLCVSFEELSNFSLTKEMFYIWLYLIVMGSLVAYSCYIYALRHLPATVVSIQSYINPIIAMFLGYFILNEPFTYRIIYGAIFTLFGVFILNYSEYRKHKA